MIHLLGQGLPTPSPAKKGADSYAPFLFAPEFCPTNLHPSHPRLNISLYNLNNS